MPTNCLGELFTVNLFGESHGECVGALVNGCPPRLKISPNYIQKELDKRKPGQSSVTTQRKEEDKIHIKTGFIKGKTTGTPILMIIENGDADSSKYDDLEFKFRPSHADFTYQEKYGIRDHRGGGFSSGRLTAGIVAAGAIAKTILRRRGITIIGYTKAIGEIEAQTFDYNEIERNPLRCPDQKAAEQMIQLVEQLKLEKDSRGGLVELVVRGVPAGIGGPRFDNLKGNIDRALHSSGAITSIEYGVGVKARFMRGSQYNDQMYTENRDVQFYSNNSGGIQGGITNGNNIIINLTVKPTPSIAKPQKTIDIQRNNIQLEVKGRHDPVIMPRLVPVAESLVAISLTDALLKQRAYG
jgi:chorismate synthase